MVEKFYRLTIGSKEKKVNLFVKAYKSYSYAKRKLLFEVRKFSLVIGVIPDFATIEFIERSFYPIRDFIIFVDKFTIFYDYENDILDYYKCN